MSTIEWTEKTWNPTAGCTLVSPGCTHCYAMSTAHRFQGRAKYAGTTRRVHGSTVWTGRVNVDEVALTIPQLTSRPTVWFVNSMSDLFHESIPVEFLRRVFAVMNRTPRHTYQILTKRDAYLVELAPTLTWTPNIWIGVSVEDAARTARIDNLRRVPARVRFLSLEPLLGPIPDLNLQDIHWAIIGGESGHRARAMHLEWARDLVGQCLAAGAAVFVKQLGSRPHLDGAPFGPQGMARAGKGGDMADWPEDLRIRVFP